RVFLDARLDAPVRAPATTAEIVARAGFEPGRALIPLDWILNQLATRKGLEAWGGGGGVRGARGRGRGRAHRRRFSPPPPRPSAASRRSSMPRGSPPTSSRRRWRGTMGASSV